MTFSQKKASNVVSADINEKKAKFAFLALTMHYHFTLLHQHAFSEPHRNRKSELSQQVIQQT